jgi:hypothetical protein
MNETLETQQSKRVGRKRCGCHIQWIYTNWTDMQ